MMYIKAKRSTNFLIKNFTTILFFPNKGKELRDPYLQSSQTFRHHLDHPYPNLNTFVKKKKSKSINREENQIASSSKRGKKKTVTS